MVEARPTIRRVVARAGIDEIAAFRRRDLIVASEAEDEVAVDGAGDHVVAAGTANDVEPARACDAGHGEAEPDGEREDDQLANHVEPPLRQPACPE